jgi:hypothetical protein
LAEPGWHLLLCGPLDAWNTETVTRLAARYAGLVAVHRLTAQNLPGALYDPDGNASRRLGLTASDTAQYLIRPDGHLGYRAGGADLTGLDTYLHRWQPGPPPDTGRLAG